MSISLGVKILNREVSLAPKSEIGNKGLFAINLSDKDDIHVIPQFVQSNAPSETKAVLTRAAKVREDKEHESDDLAEHERNEKLGKDNDSQWIYTDGFLENCMSDTVNDRIDVEEDTVCADTKGEKELTAVSDNEDVGAEEGGKEDDQGCVFEEFDMVEIPKVRKGRVMKKLAEEQSKDKTLNHCGNLADKKDKRFSWDNDILYKTLLTTYTGGNVTYCSTKTKRNDILTLAHEKSGHLGFRKVIAMIVKHFYWPFMLR